MDKTLAILKPDAIARNLIGSILAKIEENDFKIGALKMIHLSTPDAQAFYEIHKERPFYPELVEFMTESPIVVVVLEKDNAVQEWRDLMGATNPDDAADGTIRKLFAENVGRNSVHGSDSLENAVREIGFFFSERRASRPIKSVLKSTANSRPASSGVISESRS